MIDAEIARAQALLEQLQRQKEAQAVEEQRKREASLDDTMKRMKVGSAKDFIDLLRAFDDAKALLHATTDAELAAAVTTLAAIKDELKIPSNQDLIILYRNRGIASPKAKRLPQDTLDLMKAVLAAGAKVPEVAKYFKVSHATVNARKAAWKLTKRKNVKLLPMSEALKKVKGGK